MIFLAVRTKSCKRKDAFCYLSAAAFFCYIFERSRDLHIHQINHSTAILTDEVDVRFCVTIKPLNAFYCGHADRHTLLLKEV